MYKCNECRKTFEEPKKWRENHGEKFSGCPYCLSLGYDEVVPIPKEVDKEEVALRLITVIQRFNNFLQCWKLGQPIDDIEEAVDELRDFVVGMCDDEDGLLMDKLEKITYKDTLDDALDIFREELGIL